MTSSDAPHVTSSPFAHAAAAATLVALLLLLAPPPRGGVPAVEARQARGVAELAALIGAPQPDRAQIEKNVREWARFPPGGDTGVEFAQALAACSFAGVDDARRIALARRLYAITNGADTVAALPATVSEFRQAAAQSNCTALAVAGLEDALRAASRTDPRPRADWW